MFSHTRYLRERVSVRAWVGCVWVSVCVPVRVSECVAVPVHVRVHVRVRV